MMLANDLLSLANADSSDLQIKKENFNVSDCQRQLKIVSFRRLNFACLRRRITA